MTKKYRQVLKKLDDRKFKYLKGDLQSKGTQLYENLWSMFKVPNNAKEKNISVTDYAWTEEVSKAFYKHPKHRYFIKEIKDMHMAFGMWKLNAEPSDYKPEQGN